jgi:hypothetical protein
MHNVTLRHIRKSFLPWKSNNIIYLSVCVCACAWVRGCVHACSLAYRACNMYEPHCDIICGPSGSTTFLDIISQMAQFLRKSIEGKNMCVYFLYNFCLKHFSF